MGTRFFARPDRPWGPLSLLYNGYRVFPGGKMRPGRAADHSPPSSAAVMEEQSYTSTHPLGHTGPVTRSLYVFTCDSSSTLVSCNIPRQMPLLSDVAVTYLSSIIILTPNGAQFYVTFYNIVMFMKHKLQNWTHR